jgi:hypothetical protein
MPTPHHRRHTALATALTAVATRLQPSIVVLSARSKAWRACIVPCVALMAALAVAAPASADGQATVTTTVNKISYSEHYDSGGCPFPGSTEYVTGVEHRHVTDLPDGTLNVVYGITVKVLEVSDDPSVAPRERQSTDEIITHLINNGPVISHESFHDHNTVFGDIFVVTTFVAVNGDVRVDHFIGRNLPTC